MTVPGHSTAVVSGDGMAVRFDFTHLSATCMAEIAESTHLKGVYTYFWPCHVSEFYSSDIIKC